MISPFLSSSIFVIDFNTLFYHTRLENNNCPHLLGFLDVRNGSFILFRAFPEKTTYA
ncbi:hypothetical protein OSO01_14600 [Oceanobacillus sojae]|uniref:Uncharacterized protein n=1 Tax=Oceanobacillus sojae TaxID=582851 RepID=A0A511ZH10_9BACI|nr:hypothetical protein OSO01_14600 [Oceanobacillus sojae]